MQSIFRSLPSDVCHRLAFLGALFAASSLAGCAKVNNISQTTDGSATIGPRGGIVDGPDGVELRVPDPSPAGDEAAVSGYVFAKDFGATLGT